MDHGSFVDSRQWSPTSRETAHIQPVYHPLDAEHLRLTPNAQATLTEAKQAIAHHFEIDVHSLTDQTSCTYFLMEPHDALVVVIGVEDLDADMFVEIPRDHWWIDPKTTT